MIDAPARHPYAAFLARAQKPSRYVGGEYHQVRKHPATARARMCLAFPDAYEIGMSPRDRDVPSGQQDSLCVAISVPATASCSEFQKPPDRV